MFKILHRLVGEEVYTDYLSVYDDKLVFNTIADAYIQLFNDNCVDNLDIVEYIVVSEVNVEEEL